MHETIRSKVTVYYPFHPHVGRELEIVHRPRGADAPVTVVDPNGATLKVPAWMLLPQAARHELRTEATIAARGLLELDGLLRRLVERESREK